MVEIKPKTGFLAHFERFFNYTPYSLINYTPVFCQIKHIIVCRGRYIILVNHYCSICSCQVINFQIFSCMMQHPRNVASFGGFLAVWALSPPIWPYFPEIFTRGNLLWGKKSLKFLTLIALDKLLFSVFRTNEEL